MVNTIVSQVISDFKALPAAISSSTDAIDKLGKFVVQLIDANSFYKSVTNAHFVTSSLSVRSRVKEFSNALSPLGFIDRINDYDKGEYTKAWNTSKLKFTSKMFLIGVAVTDAAKGLLYFGIVHESHHFMQKCTNFARRVGQLPFVSMLPYVPGPLEATGLAFVLGSSAFSLWDNLRTLGTLVPKAALNTRKLEDIRATNLNLRTHEAHRGYIDAKIASCRAKIDTATSSDKADISKLRLRKWIHIKQNPSQLPAEMTRKLLNAEVATKNDTKAEYKGNLGVVSEIAKIATVALVLSCLLSWVAQTTVVVGSITFAAIVTPVGVVASLIGLYKVCYDANPANKPVGKTPYNGPLAEDEELMAAAAAAAEEKKRIDQVQEEIATNYAKDLSLKNAPAAVVVAN